MGAGRILAENGSVLLRDYHAQISKRGVPRYRRRREEDGKRTILYYSVREDRWCAF